VGEVVREHLVLVEPRDRHASVGRAALRELGTRALDDRGGDVDRGARGLEIRSVTHVPGAY